MVTKVYVYVASFCEANEKSESLGLFHKIEDAKAKCQKESGQILKWNELRSDQSESKTNWDIVDRAVQGTYYVTLTEVI